MLENIKKFNEEVEELMSIGMAATMNKKLDKLLAKKN